MSGCVVLDETGSVIEGSEVSTGSGSWVVTVEPPEEGVDPPPEQPATAKTNTIKGSRRRIRMFDPFGSQQVSTEAFIRGTGTDGFGTLTSQTDPHRGYQLSAIS